MNFNVNLPVLKRTPEDLNAVRNALEMNGWEPTGSFRGRVYYYENAGVNVTVVGGPRGTVVLPSGPVRGRMFGSGSLFGSGPLFGDESDQGMSILPVRGGGGGGGSGGGSDGSNSGDQTQTSETPELNADQLT